MESAHPYFWSKVKANAKDSFDSGYGIRPFIFNVDVRGNYEKVGREAEGIVLYEKRLRKSAKNKKVDVAWYTLSLDQILQIFYFP